MPLRKVAPRKPGGRRFKGTEDPEHLKRVRAMRCLIAGKRAKVGKWQGVHPNKQWVEFEVVHVCRWETTAHHKKFKSQGGHDRTAIPLCVEAHAELHHYGPKAFQRRWNVPVVVRGSELAGLSGADR